MQRLAVLFQADFLTGAHLLHGVNAVLREQADILFIGIMRKCFRRGAQVLQAAAGSLFLPLLAVAVAVEDDAAMRLQLTADECRHGLFQIRCGFELIGKLRKRFRHGGVQHDIRAGNVERGAGHPEFKLVAGEGKRRGAVAVRLIKRDGRQHGCTDGNGRLALLVPVFAGNDALNDILEVIADIHGNNGRRRLIGTQTVIVACARHRDAQQILIFIHSLDDGREEKQELSVGDRRLARIQQIFARIGRNGPVVVLAGTVDAFEGLFVQQANEAVALCNLFHQLHGKLIVVGGNICGGEHRCHFMLAGSHLVVFRLCGNTELPQLLVQILHERLYARTDGAKVMVFHLLSFGGMCAKQRAAGKDQIQTLGVILLADQEIFLLRTHGGGDALDILAKQLQHTAGFPADGIHGAQQRCLLVKNFARVGAERRGDAERVIFDKCIGSRVPCRISTRFKCSAQAAGREGRSIRFALRELLAGKFHDNGTIALRRKEGIMLFCGDARHRLEPMREMRGPAFNGPILHHGGDNVRHARSKGGALFHGLLQGFEYVLRQTIAHHGLVERKASKEFRDFAHIKHSPVRR